MRRYIFSPVFFDRPLFPSLTVDAFELLQCWCMIDALATNGEKFTTKFKGESCNFVNHLVEKYFIALFAAVEAEDVRINVDCFHALDYISIRYFNGKET